MPIPKGKGEHARYTLQRATHAPGLDRGQKGFSVRVPSPIQFVAIRSQLVAQQAVIVDLAIEGDDVATGRRLHRLVPSSGQIENRETVERHRNAAVRVRPRIRLIGAAMTHAFVHSSERRRDASTARPAASYEAGNAAHEFNSSL